MHSTVPVASPVEPVVEVAPAKEVGAGYGLLVGHLLTVWGLALSNGLLGLCVLLSAQRVVAGRVDAGLRTLRSRPARRVMLPLLLYSLVLVLSTALSYEPSISQQALSELFSLAALPLALLWIPGERWARRTVDLLLMMVTAVAVIGLGQYLFTDYGPLDNRVPGPFSHYMTFSGVLMVGDCLLLVRLAHPRYLRRARYWLAAGLINSTLFLTLTRNTWLAVLVALTILVWIASRRRFWLYALGLVVAATAIAALAPGTWDRFRSIGDLRDPSNYDRLCMTWAGLKMIAERPALGIGPEMVAERYPIYRHPTAPRPHVKHLHNTYVQMAAERGLVELLAFLWLLIVVFRQSYTAWVKEGGLAGPRSDLLLGVWIALIAFSFAGLFEANWRDTEIKRVMLIVLALPAILLSSDGSKPESGAEGVTS